MLQRREVKRHNLFLADDARSGARARAKRSVKCRRRTNKYTTDSFACHHAMRNITVVGASGDASGQRLREMVCAVPDCSDAVHECSMLLRCDTVEQRLPFVGQHSKGKSGGQRRRRNGSLMEAERAMAVLRASWSQWGARDPALAQGVQDCQALTAEARTLLPGRWLSKPRRLAWQQNYCDEYVASSGESLPDFGRSLMSGELASVNGPTCPPTGTRILLVTYQNGPSAWLCSFLRTLGYRGVHVTVLGWQPNEFVRNNNVFYFTDRVYTLLRYLLTCARSGALSPDASIMFCDSDELFQLRGGLPELEHRSDALLTRTGARVVISAEARCMPNRLGPQSWAHSLVASHELRTSRPADVKKWPRCLNTGNFVGRAAAVIDMLNQTCIPCRDGTPVEDIFRRYTRAYSAQVRSWIYSEQAELMRLYLSKPSNETGWILDYGQELFHPNFWYTAAWDTRVLPDGRIRNRYTGSASAFIHYNGDSKRTWKGVHSPRSVARALRAAYVRRTGDAQLEALKGYLAQRVSFLGPTFARDQTVTMSSICRQGSIGGEDIANVGPTTVQ